MVVVVVVVVVFFFLKRGKCPDGSRVVQYCES